MKQFLLDTNICIHYLKGEYDLQKQFAMVGYENCFISELTIAELLFGVENGAEARREKNRENVARLETAFDDRILLIGRCFAEYSRQKTQTRKVGRPVGEFDLLIGSTAIVHGLTLVTRNSKDFAGLVGIRLENWIDLPRQL